MKHVSKLLKPSLGSEEILSAARAQRILMQWPAIVGDSLAQRSRPDRFTRGTVWVAVTGSAWAQELRLMKERILEKLNEAAGEEHLFTNVRFGVRALPAMSDAAAANQSSEPAVLAHDTELSIAEIRRRRLEKRAREI